MFDDVKPAKLVRCCRNSKVIKQEEWQAFVESDQHACDWLSGCWLVHHNCDQLALECLNIFKHVLHSFLLSIWYFSKWLWVPLIPSNCNLSFKHLHHFVVLLAKIRLYWHKLINHVFNSNAGFFPDWVEVIWHQWQTLGTHNLQKTAMEIQHLELFFCVLVLTDDLFIQSD
jgi:hypothetical protein